MSNHVTPELVPDLRTGSRHYRAFVGPVERYDLLSAIQFNLLTALGLRDYHYLLDIGCGSLRAGRLFLPYLLPGRYFGIEPEQWLVEDGIAKELGQDIIRLKKPTFNHDRDFRLTAFKRRFDFLLAQSIFSHTAEKQMRRCLQQARLVMGPNSVFAATFKQGPTNYPGDDWVYPNCVTYTLDHIAKVVEDEGLACQPIDWPHPGQKWVLIVQPGLKVDLPSVAHVAYPGNASGQQMARYQDWLAKKKVPPQ